MKRKFWSLVAGSVGILVVLGMSILGHFPIIETLLAVIVSVSVCLILYGGSISAPTNDVEKVVTGTGMYPAMYRSGMLEERLHQDAAEHRSSGPALHVSSSKRPSSDYSAKASSSKETRPAPPTDTRHPDLAAGFVRHQRLSIWAASRRGRAHVTDGNPRQDAFSVQPIPEGVVVMVADGVGSTVRAEKASLEAVQACSLFQWQKPRSNHEWGNTVRDALQFINSRLNDRNLSARGQVSSTTLAVALVTRADVGYRLSWFSVGDSAISLIRLGSDYADSFTILNSAPSGEDSVTEALPWRSRVPEYEFGTDIVELGSYALVLMTDGCYKPMMQCSGPYVENYSNIVRNGADASHLLAAIRQDGVGYSDDATAIIVAVQE